MGLEYISLTVCRWLSAGNLYPCSHSHQQLSLHSTLNSTGSNHYLHYYQPAIRTVPGSYQIWSAISITYKTEMTTSAITEINLRSRDSNNPPPIELPGLGTIDEDYGCCSFCWYILSWVTSLVLYTVECFVTVWVMYTYASKHLFVPFGLSLGYFTLTHVVVVTVSLIWYYALDRFHKKRKESDPHNLAFIDYRKKFSPAAVVFHMLLLGMVYRWVLHGTCACVSQ